MPVNRGGVIPYDIAFVLLLLLVALLKGPKLALAARVLIVLYVPFAFVLALYSLIWRRSETWRESPDDGSVPDATRYSRAMKRSSAIYVVLNLVLLAVAKVLGISYSNVTYNYILLFVTTMITYMYDRCVSTDDGLAHLKASPAMTILDSYLSFCSPSFMRYLIVLACEIPLTILIAYYFGSLIPEEHWIASTLFRKSIIPIVVFSVVSGPLRFAWAYPTVSQAGRVPYLTAYIITFTLLALLTYASGSINPATAAGVLMLMAVVAVILQAGGLSNAPHEPDVVDDASVMPRWIMFILATLVVISTVLITYRIFKNFIHPFVFGPPHKALASSKQNVVHRSRLSRTL